MGITGVSVARAGTYAITANNQQVCALGGFAGNVPGFSTFCDNYGTITIDAPAGGSASGDRELWQVTSPSTALSIVGARFAGVETHNVNNANEPGYGGGAYWNGGGQAIGTGDAQEEFGFGSDSTDGSSFSSQYLGLQLVCSDRGGCAGTGNQSFAQIVNGGAVSLTVQENQGPGLLAVGSNNLFYQSQNWIWNAATDPWPASISGGDPSGVCSMSVTVDGVPSQIAAVPNTSTWQQCPSPETDDVAVDTNTYVPKAGQLSLVVSDTNAAGVTNAPAVTLNVDNVQPTVSLSALNDVDPGGWTVNHSVTLRVAPTVGPSGMSSLSCTDTLSSVSAPLKLTPDASVPGDYDVTVDGNGSHAVACSVANNAVNPQGLHNTGGAAQTVDVDEQPPTLSFEPTDPSNPSQVVVQTSDSESQVNAGSIQITAQGSNDGTPLDASLNSDGNLIAYIPDGTLRRGAYTLQASATSQAGNTGTLSETVTLPLRAAAESTASFAEIVDPAIAKRIRERVRVGFHYVKEKRHGRTVRVKRGGHFKTVTVIKQVEHCKTRRVRVKQHKWMLKRTCRAPHVSYRHKLTVGHGKRSTVYGELLTSQNVPIADETVNICVAPNNGKRRFKCIGSTTTNGMGGWKFILPAGPSRIVQARYGGSNTLLPDRRSVRLYVRARIKILATPATLPWRGTTTIHGRLLGGYIPADGVAMRLLIRIPGRKQLYSPVPFRTTKTGSFSVKWTWGSGSGVVTYPFYVATTANESDYPYVAATSKAVDIEFGVSTPRRTKHRHRSR